MYIVSNPSILSLLASVLVFREDLVSECVSICLCDFGKQEEGIQLGFRSFPPPALLCSALSLHSASDFHLSCSAQVFDLEPHNIGI